jgi:ribosome maturation protein Sdo1
VDTQDEKDISMKEIIARGKIQKNSKQRKCRESFCTGLLHTNQNY